MSEDINSLTLQHYIALKWHLIPVLFISLVLYIAIHCCTDSNDQFNTTNFTLSFITHLNTHYTSIYCINSNITFVRACNNKKINL